MPVSTETALEVPVTMTDLIIIGLQFQLYSLDGLGIGSVTTQQLIFDRIMILICIHCKVAEHAFLLYCGVDSEPGITHGHWQRTGIMILYCRCIIQ